MLADGLSVPWGGGGGQTARVAESLGVSREDVDALQRPIKWQLKPSIMLAAAGLKACSYERPLPHGERESRTGGA
jgi:hypothetical protein